jgi:hypothetical protein
MSGAPFTEVSSSILRTLGIATAPGGRALSRRASSGEAEQFCFCGWLASSIILVTYRASIKTASFAEFSEESVGTLGHPWVSVISMNLGYPVWQNIWLIRQLLRGASENH